MTTFLGGDGSDVPNAGKLRAYRVAGGWNTGVNEGLVLNLEFILTMEHGSCNDQVTDLEAREDVARFMKGKLP